MAWMAIGAFPPSVTDPMSTAVLTRRFIDDISAIILCQQSVISLQLILPQTDEIKNQLRYTLAHYESSERVKG
jgi:hypothetical protein